MHACKKNPTKTQETLAPKTTVIISEVMVIMRTCTVIICFCYAPWTNDSSAAKLSLVVGYHNQNVQYISVDVCLEIFWTAVTKLGIVIYLLNCWPFCFQTFLDGTSSYDELSCEKIAPVVQFRVTAQVQNLIECLSTSLLNYSTFCSQTYYDDVALWVMFQKDCFTVTKVSVTVGLI